jgi:hypothetical protein
LIGLLLGLALWLSGPVGRLLVGGAVTLFAPGYLAWAALGRPLRLPRLAAPAIWLGLSLSLIPLAFLWASTLGLRLTPAVLRLQALGLALLALWIWRRSGPAVPAPRWLTLGLGLTLGLTGLTRLVEIRGLNAPLWVDSVHHTLLVRIIGETGQIPRSLEPYMPVENLVYHWGYHTVAATWRGVADLPLAQAVLWSGQILNALIALVMYALGAVTLRSPRGGLLAAGVAGLFSLMPAYYVTWGRYTQLTGLLLLPCLLVTSIALAEGPRFSWRLVGLTALLLAGLMLIHYRVLVFYAAFMAPYSLLLLVRRPRQLGALIVRFGAASVLAALLAGPWVLIMLRQIIVPFAKAPGALEGSDSYNNLDWGLLYAGNARRLYIIAGVGLLLALLRWRWRIVAAAGWIATMFLLANPTVLGLKPSWFINNHSVTITLFMPVALLVAACINQLISWLLRWLPRPLARWSRPALAAAFVGVALLGAWQLRSVVNSATVLALPEDMQALEWAAQNTPPDARFLVNTTLWLNGAYRGVDAGWWLLPLAQRWVTTPPALYIYGTPAYKQAVETLNQQIAALKPDDPAQLMQLIRDQRITHIFIGKQQGGSLKADLLLSDPAFTTVYDQDGVTIFAVRATP